MSARTEREALTAALRRAGIVVYTEAPESPTPPCVVLVPDDPYIEPTTIGSRLEARVRLRLTAVAPSLDNHGSLDTLEQLLVTVWSALPQGVEVGHASRPGLTLVGPVELLTASFDVQLHADLSPDAETRVYVDTY